MYSRLAKEYYLHVNPDEVKTIPYGEGPKIGHCVIDEAQVIDRLLENQFRSKLNKLAKRSLLSPTLYGIKDLLNREAILAGTGLSLLQIENDVLTGLAKPEGKPIYFVDFELLDKYKTKKMIQTFLIYKGAEDYLEEASAMLVGRPRFVADFITRSIRSGDPLKTGIDRYLQYILNLSPDYADDEKFEEILRGKLSTGLKTTTDLLNG
jgi:hypothetical protein